jgi:diguanylate cyclase (GGDEF)-like protein
MVSLNDIQIVIALATLALSAYIGVHTLFSKSIVKKQYFLLSQTAVIIFLLGYLLEFVSDNRDEAFTGAKVMYLGSYFTAVFYLFFVADYCGFPLPKWRVKLPLIAVSFAIVVLLWTTKYHHLIYAEYDLYKSWQHILIAKGGRLYFPAQLFSFLVMIAVAFILAWSFKRKKKFRREFLVMLLALSFPIAAQLIHELCIVLRPDGFMAFFAPHSMALTNLVIYVGLIRSSALDIVPGATIAAMEYAKEAFLLTDGEDRYLSSNAALHRFFPGFVGLETGDPVTDVDDWPAELGAIVQFDRPVRFDLAGEKTRYFEASASPVRDERNGAIRAKIVLIRDVTEVTELVKKLEEAAFTDMLTGLYNRRHFSGVAEMNIERARRLGQPLCFAMLDLDFFKQVNDTWGHDAGDAVLKHFAEVLKGSLRPYDMTGRFGGEEFTILLCDTSLENAAGLLERVRANVENSRAEHLGTVLKVTCSIGLASLRDGEDFAELSKRADEALYRAKQSGRNRVCITE